MIQLAKKQQRRTKLNIEFLGVPSEHISLSDNTMDTIVSTFTLCTISPIEEAIADIGRVLKPSGELIFIEIGLSPEPSVQFWQRLLNPVYRWMFQGLYLTRDIPSLLMRGGFHIKQVDAGYLAAFPKSSSYYWSGVAQLTQP
jgi:ubiquinone/menaquinone biosynthesis C-methylase UbiE